LNNRQNKKPDDKITTLQSLTFSIKISKVVKYRQITQNDNKVKKNHITISILLHKRKSALAGGK